MSYIYSYEGSTGGYPLEEDKEWNDWYDDICAHHECCICRETRHEEIMYRTTQGWMCIDCYDYLLEIDEPETEKPELI